MLEDLLAAKKISQDEFEIYLLYQCNELGRKVLERMKLSAFMDEPSKTEFNGVGFAFYDGRRSVWRDVCRVIFLVEEELRKGEQNG